MWFTKTQDGFRGWFAVATTTGLLATGLTSGSFVVTTRNPDDTASNLSDVTESGKPGLYRFDITSSFFSAHGRGEYGVVIEVNKPAPNPIRDVMSNVLKISHNDFDSIASGSINITASSITNIVSGVWDANMSSHNISGTAGSLLFSASSGGVPTVDTSAIATAVWDRQLAAHQISGSSGFIVSQLSGTLETVSSKVQSLFDINFGRWKIVANQMIFYKPDNVTEVARFNLFDDVSSPSMDAVFERVKI